MKKWIYTWCLVLFGSTLLTAQNILSPAAQQFVCSARLEVVGGLNASKTSMDDLSDSESNKFRTGFHLGLRMNTSIGKGFSFIPGIVYEQKGTKYKYRYDDNEFPIEMGAANLSAPDAVWQNQATQAIDGIDRNIRLNYLTIPLFFDYGPIPKLKDLKVIAGLNPAFLLGHTTKVNSFGNESEQSGTDDLSTFDLALAVGVSYMFYDKFGVSAMYDHGLIDISSVEGVAESFNRTLRFSLFYRLNFNPLFKESYSKKRKELSFE
ncbi:MAG TPA: hypothetical protein DDY13_19210 [Cytophagales bacterium]|jgi:hypothetical protein|nr:hypothetical protein [Cytophagales bacterium]